MKKKRIENLIVTLIAVFISLPTYADDNANTSNAYKLVTNVSELTTDGTLFIIANKEKGTALCKDFNKLKAGAKNMVEMQPYGDFFIINENVATFRLYKTSSGYQFQLVPYDDPTNGFLSIDGSRPCLRSRSKNEMKIEINNKEGKAKARRQDPAKNLGIVSNNIKFDDNQFIYVYIYKSITPSLTLETSKSLSETVKDKDVTGKVIPSINIDRKFIADGGWYSICLPFSLTEADIKNQFKGAMFQGFYGVEQHDKTINLKFKKVTTTEAGKPYLIKPTENITAADLTFNNKLIEQTTPVDVNHKLDSDANKTFTFKGVFSPFTADSEELADKNIKFLSGKGLDLVSPNGTGTMKCYSAYFIFPGKKGSVETEAKITNHDEATAVQPVKRQEAETEHVVFSISGQKVAKVKNASQLPKGVYIINKKRIMVK